MRINAIIAGIFFVIVIPTVVILKLLGIAVDGIGSLVDVQNQTLIWVLVIGSIIGLVAVSVFGKARRDQTFELIAFTIMQYIFLDWIYYGAIYKWILVEYGIEPRVLVLVQTSLLLIVVATLYYMTVHVYKPQPGMWRAYGLITVFGSLLICSSIYFKPYVFFEHAKGVKDNKTVSVEEGVDGLEAKSKFWILRNKENEIIDLSWSPGFSATYGRALTQGTADDVSDAMEFQKKNSPVSILINLRESFAEDKEKQKSAKVSDFREFKIGEVFEMQNMKAGESNGFYIRQPMGKPSYQAIASYGTGIKAVLRDGREFDLKKSTAMPDGDYDFKIVAYEDGARVKVWFEGK